MAPHELIYLLVRRRFHNLSLYHRAIDHTPKFFLFLLNKGSVVCLHETQLWKQVLKLPAELVRMSVPSSPSCSFSIFSCASLSCAIISCESVRRKKGKSKVWEHDEKRGKSRSRAGGVLSHSRIYEKRQTFFFLSSFFLCFFSFFDFSWRRSRSSKKGMCLSKHFATV